MRIKIETIPFRDLEPGDFFHLDVYEVTPEQIKQRGMFADIALRLEGQVTDMDEHGDTPVYRLTVEK